MKTTTLLITAAAAISLLLFSCGDSKAVDQKNVAEAEAKTNPENPEKQEETKAVTRTLKFGNKTLEYTGKYLFSFNPEISENMKTDIPGLVELKFYKLITPPSAIIGLSYQKLKGKTNLQGAIDGALNGYHNIEGVKIIAENLEDVSSQYGFPAKLITGKLQKLNKNGSTDTGEFKSLFIINENEMWMIQGIVETGNSAEIMAAYSDILNSIKITQ